MTHWLNKYLSKQYNDHTFNCWQLVCEVYFEKLGICLLDYNGIDPTNIHQVSTAMGQVPKTHWTPTDDHYPYALVTMGKRNACNHVGVSIEPGKILHVYRGFTASVHTPTLLAQMGFHNLAYYRHAKDIPRS